MPLIITHGWPGSVVEFWDIIGPLTDPAAYGGSPSDAFDLVIPSIPGYGFSGPTHDRGWDARRVARAWAELMSLLGYRRYGAQGGDWGSIISRELGLAAPGQVAGVHLNMLITRVPDDAGELTEEESRRREAARRFRTTGSGYSAIQGPGRRPWPTAWLIRRPGSWRGSPRSSASGPTTGGRTRRSTGTSCSPTSRCTG